jgi:hypothetical protein
MNRSHHYRSGYALALVIASVFIASEAPAALISFSGNSSDGHPVSGTADFTLGAGTLTVKLTNTTATTLDAGELFTGLDFSLGGLTPSLTSSTGIERTVAGSGAFSDTGSAQNLSWSLASVGGGSFQLNFTPNAEGAIIAPPSGGNYSGATGSINGNSGHNPFAAVTATFVLNVPGATLSTPVSVSTFRFGTTLDPVTNTTTTTTTVPEPGTIVLLLLGLVVAFAKRVR